MTSFDRIAALTAALVLALAAPAAAQDASPSPAAAMPWPSGDELRRELQDVGFAFRVDRDTGDWLGWAPRASIVEAPAIRLGGAGAVEATATFGFDLLQTDLLGGDVDAALTAFMETTARLPLDAIEAERARQFVVADLLTEPPESLEACYLSDRPTGVLLITVDTETGLAELDVARELSAIDPVGELEAENCVPIRPSTVGPPLGEASSERITIGMTAGAQVAFDPAETSLEGDLVTLVLTFRNDSAVEQTLTFEAPLESDTGPVAPGELKLVVIRQLEPGEYGFFSRSDPDGITGRIRITARE